MPKTTTSFPAPHHCKQDFGYSRTVNYTSGNHISLICQRWGSINRKVLPFCAVNILICLALVALLNYGIDLTISEFGHEFMSVILAFLVINKFSFTLSLYYELQGNLSIMNQAVIDIVQLACTFTKREFTVDNSAGRNSLSFQAKIGEYKQYRFKIAHQSIVLLKATCAVIHKGGEYDVWKMAEFDDDPLLLHVPEDTSGTSTDEETHGRLVFPKEMYVMGQNMKSDLNLRVPIHVAQRLRDDVMKHTTLPESLNPMQEMQLMTCIKDFITGYRGIRKYLTAPLPLPLVQLGRIFVFAYVFTLPFALLSADLELKEVQVIMLVVLMTYGFVGCELLFVELDDPFAEDPNDLPLIEEAKASLDDIVLSLYQTDGLKAAEALTKTIKSPRAWFGPEFYGHQIAKNESFFTRKRETEPLIAGNANSK
jgi:predicted membrane chloride channel (bestrophin family)